MKGRTLLDWTSDCEALMNELGIDRFVVAGWSGGGPHALAVAYRLRERVTKVVLASALASFDQPRTRDLVLNEDLRLIWRLNRFKIVPGLVGRFESRKALRDLSGSVEGIADEAPADRPVLCDPELRPMFEAEMGEALRQRGTGVLDDMWAFVRWDFRPEEVEQPVQLFYGDADEILAPEMTKRLAGRLRSCHTTAWPGGGHYAVFAYWREFLEAAVS